MTFFENGEEMAQDTHSVAEECEVFAARTRLGSGGLLGHVVEVLGGEVGGVGEGAAAWTKKG